MTPSGQGAPILQTQLPFTPWEDPALARMPGMKPVDGSWITVDDAYGAQMAERARLMSQQRGAILQAQRGSKAAQAEALEIVLEALPAAFRVQASHISCPDGRDVAIDGAPFDVLNQLVQEDILILERRGGEHVLIAGLLCFPASWTLSEKIGRPLTAIHRPVPRYDGPLARRVQSIFDRVPPGQVMWRANALGYARADLHQPKTEAAPKDQAEAARYLRCERQTVLRLPRSGAILFAVHTFVVRPEALTADQAATCPVDFAR